MDYPFRYWLRDADFATVPSDLMSAFQIIPYQSAEDAVFKAMGVE